MLRFLSNIKLCTRVYACLVFLGGLAVCLSFAGLFVVDVVHTQYAKANSSLEGVRRLSAIELSLFSLNRSVDLFFEQEDRQTILELFADYEARILEQSNSLDSPEVKKVFIETMLTALTQYRAQVEELFSLRDAKNEATQKSKQYADIALKKLTDMVEETTLPSATFALNALQEQLEIVSGVMDGKGGTLKERLKQEIETLNKVSVATKQAEMINAKQLKVVLTAIEQLEEEINKKNKLENLVEDKIKNVQALSSENVKILKEQIDKIIFASTSILTKAESKKLFLQKIFVLFAFFSGLLTLVAVFISLYGFKDDLALLIEGVRCMARGELKVALPLSDRLDEIGDLSTALSGILLRLNDPMGLTQKSFVMPTTTYGASMAYVPLGSVSGSKQDSFEPEIAYFGEGTGVDVKSQLYQMLALIKHAQVKAALMTETTQEQFKVYDEKFEHVLKCVTQLSSKTDQLLVSSSSLSLDQIVDVVDFLKNSFGQIFVFLNQIDHISNKNMLYCQKIEPFMAHFFDFARQIESLSDFVQKSAFQTKILALNASIETAKVGEKGRVLSGCVSQMRTLSQQTSETADQMYKRIEDIQSQISDFVKTMTTVLSDIKTTHAFVQDATLLTKDLENQAGQNATFLDTLSSDFTAFFNSNELLKDTSVLVKETDENLPALRAEMQEIKHTIQVFIAELPTYEEEKSVPS